MRIKCEKELCIYEKDGYCILDNIGINNLAMCDECIIPTFDDYYVKIKKEETLKELSQYE